MITKKLLMSSALAALVLVGCGGGGSSSATTGYFVDAAVANADYDCVADGNVHRTTGADGSFTCTNMSQVRFRIGHLILGEIHALHTDKHVFPQDLVGVTRDTGVNDARVIAMAQLLQSIDSDGNPSNGITITQERKEAVAGTDTAFNPTQLPVYLNSASVTYRPTPEQAKQHLIQTLHGITGNAHDTAHDTAQDAHDTAHDTAQGAHDTAHDTAQGAHDTAHDTAQGAHDTAHNVAGIN
jgi:hypothetical protein